MSEQGRERRLACGLNSVNSPGRNRRHDANNNTYLSNTEVPAQVSTIDRIIVAIEVLGTPDAES